MIDRPLSPDRRFVLHQLAQGSLLWLYGPAPTEDAWLHTDYEVSRVARRDFDELLGRGFIAPVLGVTSKLYGITEAGRERVGDETGLRMAG